jgi:hypothetical protein
MRWLFNPTEREQINHMLLNTTTGTKQQPMSDITHRDEVTTRNESLLYLLKLLPTFECEGEVHVTRRASSMEAKHVSEEYVTGHGANEEIGQVQLLCYSVNLTHDGHGNRINRTIRLDAKHG